VIYVALVERLKLLKVGFSDNLPTRIVELAIAAKSPVTVVAAMPGTLADERSLHARLAPHRAAHVDARKGCGHTEFYEVCDATTAWLASLPASARYVVRYGYAPRASGKPQGGSDRGINALRSIAALASQAVAS
jgi:hypothetical protein